ncbi:MAG: branched-chain amino acid ABC transporter permease [Acidobacteria bacterium]|nr:branched-chain amino acid ABC transporter permease [Acidobacteriota bacterium]
MNYLLHLIIIIELNLLLTCSLNIMVGYTGLLTLAHAAFYGVGAYITALLMVNLGFGFLPSLIFAVIGCVSLSVLISLASLRFRGDFFILTTLALQVILFRILYNWTEVTQGPYGITNIPKPRILGMDFNSLESFSLLGFLLTTIVVGLLILILRSPFGRTLQAIRDDELAAIALGKSVMSFKVRSVSFASGCAAIAGALYATYITFIDPTSFTKEESMLMLAMVIVGGTGNIKGPIVGAFLLTLLPEFLRFLAIPDSLSANLRIIIYGLSLIVMMRFRPAGIAGKYQFE